VGRERGREGDDACLPACLPVPETERLVVVDGRDATRGANGVAQAVYVGGARGRGWRQAKQSKRGSEERSGGQASLACASRVTTASAGNASECPIPMNGEAHAHAAVPAGQARRRAQVVARHPQIGRHAGAERSLGAARGLAS
jgi:hypothetical protein